MSGEVFFTIVLFLFVWFWLWRLVESECKPGKYKTLAYIIATHVFYLIGYPCYKLGMWFVKKSYEEHEKKDDKKDDKKDEYVNKTVIFENTSMQRNCDSLKEYCGICVHSMPFDGPRIHCFPQSRAHDYYAICPAFRKITKEEIEERRLASESRDKVNNQFVFPIK